MLKVLLGNRAKGGRYCLVTGLISSFLLYSNSPELFDLFIFYLFTYFDLAHHPETDHTITTLLKADNEALGSVPLWNT